MITTASLAVGTALLLTLLGLALPKRFLIERRIEIHKPAPVVFEFLKCVRSHDQWNPWARKDPTMEKKFKGQDATVGFIYSWSGRSAGVGEQEIMSITNGHRIDFELRFKKPFVATSSAYLKAESADENRTRVTWGMSGRSPFPLNLMHALMKGKLGRDFDDGLRQLKSIIEQSL